MALSFATGMTIVEAAEAITNWDTYRITGGGNLPPCILNTEIARQGSACVGGKAIGSNWDSGLIATLGASIDITAAGNEVIAIWGRIDAAQKSLTQAANGIYIIASSGTETGTAVANYRRWSVSGSDVYQGGWQLFLIDTRKAASVADTGTFNPTLVRRIGIGNRSISSVGTILTENMYADAIYNGRPVYTLTGDGALAADWDSFYQHSITDKNGLIEKKGGILYFNSGIRFGSDTQTATTTFSDATGQSVIFNRQTYHNGTSLVDALNYGDYYGLDAKGAAGFNTSVAIGSVVGIGDDRQGVLGGSIAPGDYTNVALTVDFSTDIAHLSSVDLNGVSFLGISGGVAMDDGSKTSAITCTFVNTSAFTGATNNGAEMLNCFMIDPKGATNNYGLVFEQVPVASSLTHNVKNMKFITSGVPTTQYMTAFSDSSDYALTFTNMEFFGDYVSSTIQHGINTGTNADVTINALGTTNVQSAQFTNSNAGTVAVVASYGFDITGLELNTEVTIVVASTSTELYHVENSSVSDGAGKYKVTYTHGGGGSIDVLLMHTGFQPDISNIYGVTLPASNSSAKVAMFADLNYFNP